MSSTTKSTRKWAPKGKGGCSTCKSRHIRCDDQHPRCTPCQKSSRQCEYSANPNPDPLKIVHWQPTNSLVLRQPSPNPSHTNDEARAFDFFRTRVAVTLGGFFDSSFWTQDVLQVAQQEDPIRHAIVALASLSEGMLKRSQDAVATVPGPLAIQQYSKAISNLKGRMQGGNESSAEVVLITCALFICIEMFQNNHESALSQMSSGVYVFYNWHSRQRSPRSIGHPKLAVQLEGIFGRLMLQTILFVETQPAEWKFVAPEFTPVLPLVPSVFRAVDEARDYLNSCMCSLYHRVISAQLHGLGEQDVTADPTSQLGSDPLAEWSRSFRSFVFEEGIQLSPKEQKAALLLEMQHMIASILAVAGPYSQETIFDRFEQDFSQTVALASRLLTMSPAEAYESSLPTFDMGILPQLYFVASRCRHPSIRRQALHLLRQGPSQEGIWHREMLTNIAERLMCLEEMDCEGAQSSVDVPASVRLSVINAKIDSARRIVTLHCCRQQSVDEGRTNVIHELVEY
ncbi:uncharacterized protein PAC_07704 [Phialocephala subalpina]|uniref:Zn(2)-C6 fungal-type domain-containing protein n=1 Tax=Phialocephala subalpina TaxID=576137 RepID=A0A1L7WYH3_9HELO|nr:uncharacterized protein PAC_07704 [Phialocephala subalpina]